MQDIFSRFVRFLPDIKNSYIVGGAVRDIILKKKPEDIDIVTTGDHEKYALKLAEKLRCNFVELGKGGKKNFRVVSGKKIFDISPLNGKNIYENLNDRDFTINAIAFDIFQKKIVDPLGGCSDIKKKKVRQVSDRIFADDPVRMIRAFRFAAFLDFHIDKETIALVGHQRELVKKSAAERITAELMKIFETSYSYPHIEKMAETSLLFSIFPDLRKGRGVLQNRHHDFDVFTHTMRSYCAIEALLSGKYKKLAIENRALLKFAILLHDCGKPYTKTIDHNGNIHFYGHEKKGAEIAFSICSYLKMSCKAREYINFIIKNHIKGLHMFKLHSKDLLTDRAKARFFIKSGNRTPDILVHTIADIMGKKYKLDRRDKGFIFFAEELHTEFMENFLKVKAMPPLVTGYDLINIFGLKPSPLFKEMLDSVEEAKVAKKISTKAEALDMIYEHLQYKKNRSL